MLNQALNVWRKPIPQKRDRTQSKILVWVLGPLLALRCFLILTFSLLEGGALRNVIGAAFVVSLLFALAAWKLGSATPGAALCGGMVCLLLTSLPSPQTVFAMFTCVLPLLALFALTFLATRAGKRRKVESGLAESHKGRSASQVLANLGAAGVIAALPYFHVVDGAVRLGLVLVLATLTEATADTVSSEIGQAFGGRPILLATLRRVEPGTDGAVTLLGTLAGIAAAAVVAAIGTATLGLGIGGFAIALSAGTAGLFFDSLLGATIERRGWLGNDWVNFTSTAFAALLAFVLLTVRWHRLP